MKCKNESRDRRASSLAATFRSAIRRVGLTAAFSSCLLTWSGCTRQQYRCKTDTEAYYLLDEKRQQSCEIDADVIRIELDPRSRMFDPFNPDRPPMPEDDPQANKFMRCVDGKKGYPLWEGNGRTNIAENPEWWNYLPLDDRGVLVLDLEDSVRIALLESPDYQRNLETMYLSALDVSIERFRLDSQFFAGTGTNFRRSGPLAANNPFGATVAGIGPGSASMRKLYSTGATLVADVANSLTWQIAGPDTFTAPSLLSFTFMQPILRSGGRDVVLERLTLAERALLTNVRAFERYRRGFYTEIATGVPSDTSPSRQGGAFGGAGLGGFDALGSVFANAGGGGGFGGGGNAVQNANGYIGLLQDQLNIVNQRENIVQLQDIYLQYEDNYRELLLTMPLTQTEIPTQQLQVAQSQQQVYQSQNTLLTLQTAYESTLDNFKRVLGLPPYLCVEIVGEMLDRFQLISLELRNRKADLATLRAAVGNANTAILTLSVTEREPETGQSFRTIAASGEVTGALDTLSQRIAPISQVLDSILNSDMPVVRADIEKLKANIPKRRRQLNRLKDVAERERGMVCSLLPLGDFNTEFLDGVGLEELPDELTADLDRLQGLVEKQVEELDKVIESIITVSENLSDFESSRERFSEIAAVLLSSQDLIAGINENVLAIQIVQAKARTQSVVLPEVDLETRDAVEIARQNRRDWLIRKASLVDTWRRIELVADDLESLLNLSLSGDVRNPNASQNPFALHSSTGNLRASLIWDAPITRVQERNNYRQILIQYQQARRAYYQYEDGIWLSLRTALRQVLQSQLAFEIQRFAVQNAALQISVNEDIRQINETLGQGSGPTAARDSLQGINDFLGTQSQLIGLYATFESRRRVLDRDLGTMQIDAEGLWIDPGPITLDTVGGELGRAIMEFGLEEGEELIPNGMEIAPSLEVVPSDQLPAYDANAASSLQNPLPPVFPAPMISPPSTSGAFVPPEDRRLHGGSFPTTDGRAALESQVRLVSGEKSTTSAQSMTQSNPKSYGKSLLLPREQGQFELMQLPKVTR